MPSSTLRPLTLVTLLVSFTASCGSSDSSVLVTLSNLPTRAQVLAVSATLDQQPLTGTSMKSLPLMLPLDQNQLGITVPMRGRLALDIKALDSDQCTHGSANPELDVIPGLSNLSAPLTTQSPRKCGNLAPCALGTACANPSSRTTNSIRSVWPISANDIWAVGTAGTVLHYDGSSWSVTPTANLPVPATTQFNGVWASASNDVWAVGTAGRIIHYDGTKWSQSTSGATRDLQGISGVSGQSIWTVGLATSTTTPAEFWHWNGSSWGSINPYGNGSLYSVLAVSPSFVVGGGDRAGSGILWVWDGVNMFKNYSADAIVPVYALWASSITNVIAVGAIGEILRFDGTIWRLTSNSYSNDFNAITHDGSTFYIVGSGGFAVRSSDPTLTNLTAITNVPMAADLWSARAASNGLVWLGGDSGFASYLDSRP